MTYRIDKKRYPNRYLAGMEATRRAMAEFTKCISARVVDAKDEESHWAIAVRMNNGKRSRR